MGKIAEKVRNKSNPDLEEIGQIIDFLTVFADKCHHGKEETVLFPAMIEMGMSKEAGPIAVMLHDHDLGRGHIQKMASALDALKKGDQSAMIGLAEAMEGYSELLQSHIQKEDNILFPMANRLLPENKQDEIYNDFERIEEEVVGHGVHERYHQLLDRLKAKYL